MRRHFFHRHGLLVAAFVLAALALCYAALRFSPYPALDEFLCRDWSTRFYDRDGVLIQVTPVPATDGLRREWTELKEIPRPVQKAFLHAEDRFFYVHGGVNWLSVMAAAVQNARAGRTVRGASTITMQLVRIIEPRQERTLRTKFREVLDAWRLETRFSKRELLELYLNSVPFGSNCEGVTSAARTFFGAELSELDDAQITGLALVPRNPAKNNPFAQNPALVRFSYPFFMPHYVDFLKTELSDSDGRLPPEVRLSASIALEQLAQRLCLQSLDEASGSRIANASVLLIENSTGAVLAWLGNADWFNTGAQGQVDGVRAKNQPGSSMKPFLYALALEAKGADGLPLFSPNSVLADVPREFGGERVYIPANFNNRCNGPVRMRVCLASSLNIPAVSLLNEVGRNAYLDRLYALGFDSLAGGAGEQAGLGLALGAGEVRLSELVPAFSVFVRDGVYLPLSFLQENPAVKPRGEDRQIYEPDTARIICSFLSDKSARAKGFGYSQRFETEYPAIFKTGTSNQYQDIIALGATKQWTVGVWMGNFSGETVMGKTGSSLPAWVARRLLDELVQQELSHENPGEVLQAMEFNSPEGFVLRQVCPLSGLAPGSHCPHAVTEYVRPGTELAVCDWHTEGGITYPAEYQQWFRLSHLDGSLRYDGVPLSVLTPNDGAVFYYDSANREHQAITLEATGGQSDLLEVFYESMEFISDTRPFIVSLPVEHGTHTVVLRCGGEETQVTFSVR